MTRVFVALDLPDAVREVMPAPGEGWRAVPASNLHVTLAFLGSVSHVSAVCSAVEAVVAPVGELVTEGVVLLPPRRPRVMAVRLADPSASCVALQAAVSGVLSAAGLYSPERRRWLPHVTIGRARGPVGRDVPSVPSLTFQPPSVTVYSSRPGPGGSRYEPLGRWDVGRTDG